MHEQANASVKGDGGAVGLTDNAGALLWWKVAGPELARMTEEFEESISSAKNNDQRHHEQVLGVQVLFKKDAAALKDDCALISRLYIACQHREGNLHVQEFFKLENHPCPPHISGSDW